MDLDRITKKLDALAQKSGGGGARATWRPEPGSQVIRLLPYKHDPDWPFVELFFNYEVTPRTTISPISFKRADPIAEFADKLKSTGDKSDYSLGRKIQPKMRTYVPILVRGAESEGVKYWGFGKTVYEELLKTMNDPDYGDITDLKNGTDITIEYERPPGEFAKTTFRVKRNSSPASTDKVVLAAIKDMMKVEDNWTEPTYEELQKHLSDYVDNNASDETEESDSEPTTQSTDLPAFEAADAPASPSKTPIKKAAADIDEAFSELFES